MTLTSAQRVRLKIQDQPLRADLVHYGDGIRSDFPLPHGNITSGTAYVNPGATAWSSTGATFDVTGFISFSSIISANSAFRTVYITTTFSDDEITQFLTDGGSVNGAATEAVTTLMFDSLKRARWTAPDGSSFDDTAAMNQLRALYDMLKKEQEADIIAGGSVDSWSLTQGDY